MKIKVVSTWNNKLFKEYAHRFQYNYNWPFELEIYNEDEGMYDEIPTLKKFVDRNKVDIPLSFQKDAVRFSYKVYAYCHAIKQYSNYDFIMGVDADSVFYNPMTEDVVRKELYREDCMMTYLGRGGQYARY